MKNIESSREPSRTSISLANTVRDVQLPTSQSTSPGSRVPKNSNVLKLKLNSSCWVIVQEGETIGNQGGS